MDPFMDLVHGLYLREPPLIFEDEFNHSSKLIFGTLKWTKLFLLPWLWAPHILHLFNFFSIPYDQCNGFVLVWWRSNHTWREKQERLGGSSLLCSSFFLSSRCVKTENKTVAYETREEAYARVFVTTTISTWMNGNLPEPTCKCPQTCQTSNQLPCLIIRRSFYAWVVTRI